MVVRIQEIESSGVEVGVEFLNNATGLHLNEKVRCEQRIEKLKDLTKWIYRRRTPGRTPGYIEGEHQAAQRSQGRFKAVVISE